MMPLGGGSRTDVHSWRAPGLSEVMGGIGSGTVPRPLPANNAAGSCPAPTPPMAAFLNWGRWESRIQLERQTRQPHTRFGVQEMGTHTHTRTRGTLLVVSTRGKERAGGFKNKRICSALLKIEKVALNSSPTKGLKVKQAPNRKRLSAK